MTRTSAATVLVIGLVIGNGPKLVAQDGASRIDSMTALIARVREEEARFANHSASFRTSWKFSPPSADEGGGGGFGAGGRVVLRAYLDTVRQDVNGPRFRYRGEEIVELTSDERLVAKHFSVCDGADTRWIDDDSSTLYRGIRSEPPQMRPPHTWGVFSLDVAFPLSVYLGGTEALKENPKVGRSAGGGTRYEFSKVEAELQGEETVDGLACLKVLVRRWYHVTDRPVLQTLWLATERNYHVARTRWASPGKEGDVPQEESRVLKWKEAAPGVWYPAVVEMRSIAPTRKSNDDAEPSRRLFVESLVLNPSFEETTFRLPDAPESLLKFEIDAKGLADSPSHPKPAAASEETTLESILKRLAVEEARYDNLEITTVERHRMANVHQLSSSGSTAVSEKRQRSVVAGGRALLESTNEYRSPGNVRSTSDTRQAFDGAMTRTWDRWTQSDPEKVQESASVRLGDANETTVVRPHSVILYSHEHARSLHKFLASGLLGDTPMTVSYDGDELVGGLHCHRLQCDVGAKSETYKRYFVIWLARDRNLIPVRRQWVEAFRYPTLPTGIHWADDFREIRPGLWFPHHISHVAFRKMDRDGLDRDRTRVQWREDLSVESLKLDPAIDAKEFSQLEVSQGIPVYVTDATGKRLGEYKQPETGNLEPSAKQIEALREQAEKRDKK